MRRQGLRLWDCIETFGVQVFNDNLFLRIMHSLSLLYFVHVAKLAFQFSVIFISRFDASSRLLIDLPIFVSILSVAPLCHVLVPLWYPVELERLCLLGYFCICIVLGAAWYGPIHNLDLSSFVLVTIADIIAAILFTWMLIRRRKSEQLPMQERLEEGGMVTRERERGDIQVGQNGNAIGVDSIYDGQSRGDAGLQDGAGIGQAGLYRGPPTVVQGDRMASTGVHQAQQPQTPPFIISRAQLADLSALSATPPLEPHPTDRRLPQRRRAALTVVTSRSRPQPSSTELIQEEDSGQQQGGSPRMTFEGPRQEEGTG